MRPPAPPPPIDRARIDAVLAEIGLWLCAVAAWLAELCAALGLDMRALKLDLRAELRRASQGIEAGLFLLACPDIDARAPAPYGGRSRTWRHAPAAGFRRAGPGAPSFRAVRRALASPMARQSLAQRIARLRDLLARKAVWIARIVRRVCKGPHGARFLAVRPPAEVCPRVYAIAAPDAADTS